MMFGLDPFLLIGIGITALTIVVAIFSEAAKRRQSVAARIQAVKIRGEGGTAHALDKDPVNVRRASDKPGGLESRLGRFVPRQSVVRARLEKTGLQISPTRYAMVTLVAIALAIVVAWGVFAIPVPLAVLGGLGMGLLLPHMIVGMLIARRARKFVQLFPDAIDLMVRSLKSGLPITEAIAAAGHEISDPVGGEFRKVSDAVRFGQTLEEALWATAARLDAPEFKFFVISLSVQKETGGNLAETLANLSDILRKRGQMRLKVKAMSSEAKASAYILGSLPFLMFAILLVVNSGYVMTLITDPRGNVAAGLGLFLIGLGILAMWRMVRFEI